MQPFFRSIPLLKIEHILEMFSLFGFNRISYISCKNEPILRIGKQKIVLYEIIVSLSLICLSFQMKIHSSKTKLIIFSPFVKLDYCWMQSGWFICWKWCQAQWQQLNSFSVSILFFIFRWLWKQFLFQSYDNVFAQFKLHIPYTHSFSHRRNGTIFSEINAFGAAFLNADELIRMHLLDWFIMVCRVCYLFHISVVVVVVDGDSRALR